MVNEINISRAVTLYIKYTYEIGLYFELTSVCLSEVKKIHNLHRNFIIISYSVQKLAVATLFKARLFCFIYESVKLVMHAR